MNSATQTKKYTLETVNPLAPPPRGPSSLANRALIESVTERKDGRFDLNIRYQGKPRSFPINPNQVLGQNQKNMVLRNQYGIQVSPKEVVAALTPKE